MPAKGFPGEARKKRRHGTTNAWYEGVRDGNEGVRSGYEGVQEGYGDVRAGYGPVWPVGPTGLPAKSTTARTCQKATGKRRCHVG
jgi:hypothetical protein